MRISDWSSDVCSSDLRRTAVAMLGAAKEIALFIARDRPRGGDAVQRRDHLCDIILDQPLGADARLLIKTLVAHAVAIAVDALVAAEAQTLRLARPHQGAHPAYGNPSCRERVCLSV